jgi:hypothetical protein
MPIQIELMALLLADARDPRREDRIGRREEHRRGANFFGTEVRYIFRTLLLSPPFEPQGGYGFSFVAPPVALGDLVAR